MSLELICKRGFFLLGPVSLFLFLFHIFRCQIMGALVFGSRENRLVGRRFFFEKLETPGLVVRKACLCG
jgi:hypothetical protein